MIFHPALRVAAIAASLPLLAGGCAALSDDRPAASSDSGEVVAAFYPLQFVTQRVAGDAYEVVNLTRAGYEPHDLDLSIRETAAVTDAALVVHLGGFQAAVDDAVRNNATGAVLDVAEAADLLVVGEDEHDDGDHADEEHGHGAEDEGDDHDDHDHGDHDPHFWLDPLRMADVADAVADELARVSPDHADDFTANAADLRADLEALDAAYTDGLAACRTDTVVVSHHAFGYLERYGLTFEAVAGLSPGAEPSAADLAHLHQVIEDEGVTTVFSETLVSPRLTESLASDLGIDTAVLDPIEGLTDESAEEDYLSLMEQNLAALVEANGC